MCQLGFRPEWMPDHYKSIDSGDRKHDRIRRAASEAPGLYRAAFRGTRMTGRDWRPPSFQFSGDRDHGVADPPSPCHVVFAFNHLCHRILRFGLPMAARPPAPHFQAKNAAVVADPATSMADPANTPGSFISHRLSPPYGPPCHGCAPNDVVASSTTTSNPRHGRVEQIGLATFGGVETTAAPVRKRMSLQLDPTLKGEGV